MNLQRTGKTEGPLLNGIDVNGNELALDTYLRDISKKDIDNYKKHYLPPLIELYSNSSWLHLKNNLAEQYNKFKNYNKDLDQDQDKDGTILTLEQIHEINIFMNNLSKTLT